MADALNAWLRRFPTWPVYAAGLLMPGWFLWLGLTGGLGAEPIRELEHRLGLLALQTLLASLAVTPLRRLTGVSFLRFRRALGLLAFYYVCLHLLVWLVLDVQILSQIWADIVKRPYITVGMAAFVLLLPLAATSTDGSLRRLGAARWRRLHRLAYPAVLLAAAHFVMLTKGWQLEPLFYFGVALVLLLLRLAPAVRRRATA